MCRKSSCFTLVEVVLAVAIFAVISGLTATLLFAVPRGWETMQRQADRAAELVRMDRIADEVIRNAIPFAWPLREEDATTETVFVGEPRELLVAARRAPRATGEGGVWFVALACRDGKLIAQYREQPIRFWDAEELPQTLIEEVIADGIREFRFRYAWWNDGRLEWLDRWDRDPHRATVNIPVAIAWEIEFEDGTKLSYLRRTAGNSDYTSYGGRNDEKN